MTDAPFKYVWLNLNTGEFSNSWDEKDQNDFVTNDILDRARQTNWKLIKYQCLTDENFDFYSMMKLVSNTSKK